MAHHLWPPRSPFMRPQRPASSTSRAVFEAAERVGLALVQEPLIVTGASRRKQMPSAQIPCFHTYNSRILPTSLVAQCLYLLQRLHWNASIVCACGMDRSIVDILRFSRVCPDLSCSAMVPAVGARSTPSEHGIGLSLIHI